MTVWDYDSEERRSRAIEALGELAQNVRVVRALVIRDMKVRYKRSLFGVAWSLASPLLMMIVLTVAFSQAFARAAPLFPVFLFPALLLWNFFAQTTTSITTEVAAGVDLWRRMRMPKTAPAIAATITGLIHLAIAVAAFIPILLILGRPIGLASLTLPIVALLTAGFTLGFALIAASVALFFPDVGHLFQVVISAWMFVTPVIYPMSMLPERFQRLVGLNPMTAFVTAFRDPLYSGRAASPLLFINMLTIAVVTLAIGWIAFNKLAEEGSQRG